MLDDDALATTSCSLSVSRDNARVAQSRGNKVAKTLSRDIQTGDGIALRGGWNMEG